MANLVLAEDDVSMADAVAEVLRDAGYTVTVCHDGEDLMRCLRERVPDLLVLDLMMPKKNGWQVLDELSQQRLRIPVLVFTASVTEKERDHLLRRGQARAVVSKTEDPDVLVIKIEEILKSPRCTPYAH